MKGIVWKVGDNISTDDIVSGKYLNVSDPRQLGEHCLETIIKDFSKKVNPGEMIVAGSNFGCGSSREHAPLAIHSSGIACVIASTFARIFYRNCINIGLPIIECRKAADRVKDRDLLKIDFAGGTISNITQSEEYIFSPFPPFLEEIIRNGGLMHYTWKKLNEKCISD